MAIISIHSLHDWDLPPAECLRWQRELAARVLEDRPLPLGDIHTVAGVDVSARRGAKEGQAAAVTLSFPALDVLETQVVRGALTFPYRTGLLSWRELPLILKAVERLSARPDVYLVDGMGRLHPRRFGLACHLGLWLEAPTVGIGKSRLLGEYGPLARERGARQPIRQQGETLGVALRTRTGVKPIFVSVGHRVELDSAVVLALACAPQFRLPEPIRAAHQAAAIQAKSAIPSSVRPS